MTTDQVSVRPHVARADEGSSTGGVDAVSRREGREPTEETPPAVPMRLEDVPPSWGGPIPPPQQHQLAQSAEFGKRVLRHQRHENDLYYRVQIPLETVLKWRYENGAKRALTWTREDDSTKALRRLSISLRYGRMSCGCIGSHHWFAPCNPYAQADYEGELLGAVRP